MRNWTYWDWIAYTGLAFSVLIPAAKDGLKELSVGATPQYLLSPIWTFLPAILFIGATCILIARAFGWIGGNSSRLGSWSDKMEPINERTYLNETIEIDGKSFNRCKFTNVKFFYRGTGPVAVIECEIQGSLAIETDSKGAHTYYMLSERLQSSSSRVVIGTRNPVSGEIKVFSTMTRNPEQADQSDKQKR